MVNKSILIFNKEFTLHIIILTYFYLPNNYNYNSRIFELKYKIYISLLGDFQFNSRL